MKFIKSKKGIAILATLVVAVATAVGAYAYFTTSGNGSGSATVGAPTQWTVTTNPASLSGGPLTPSGPAETLKFKVKNDGSGDQLLSSLKISVATTTGTAPNLVSSPFSITLGGHPPCTAADFSIDGAPVGTTATDTVGTPAVPIDLVPGNSYTGTLTIQMIDNNLNQDSCIGATVPLFLVAS